MARKLIMIHISLRRDPNYPDLPVQWRPSTPQEPCYLNINDTLEVIDGQLNNERMQFWNKLKKRLMNN